MESLEEYGKEIRSYSTDELEDVLSNINREEYADRFKLVIKELKRRGRDPEPRLAAELSVRTHLEGVRSGGIRSGIKLIKESFRIFDQYPKFLIPLLVTWAIYAPIILYVRYGINFEALSCGVILLICVSEIFLLSSIISISCLILLELIRQVESGEKPSFFISFDRVVENSVKAIPLVVLWTVIWFILAFFQALLRKAEREIFSAENAAKTLADYQERALLSSSLNVLQKGVRMVVYLILPGIAWEGLRFREAFKRGLGVFKANFVEFATGFILSDLAAQILFLPPALLFMLHDGIKIHFLDSIWIGTIFYTAFAWSFFLYIEQMFCAQLYLWHMKWERKFREAQKEGEPLPRLSDVPRPSLLDEVPDLVGT